MWVTAVIANLPELLMWIGFGGLTVYSGRRYERWLWGLPAPASCWPWWRSRNITKRVELPLGD